jgi:hypothetical protein
MVKTADTFKAWLVLDTLGWSESEIFSFLDQVCEKLSLIVLAMANHTKSIVANLILIL